MDRSKSREWNANDLRALIANEVQEDNTLEYKACDALSKQDAKTNELSKDVSAFANSVGGIIVYGIVEKDHLPTEIDKGFDPDNIKREWLEQVIQGRIKPAIEGIHINPVSLDLGKVAYVVTIPESTTAHQAYGGKYYRRYNFSSVPMEDHEIRLVMNRLKHAKIEPVFSINPTVGSGYYLNLSLRNTGLIRARDVKIIFTLPLELKPHSSQGFSEKIDTETGRIEILAQETDFIIFPKDERVITDQNKYFFKWNKASLEGSQEIASKLYWKIFADDMPPKDGSILISEIPGFPFSAQGEPEILNE